MKDDNVIGKKWLIVFLLPPEVQHSEIRGINHLFWLEAQIISSLQASPSIVCFVVVTWSIWTWWCLHSPESPSPAANTCFRGRLLPKPQKYSCNLWIDSSWMCKECECMFVSHSSYLKSKERMKESPWDFIDSALPWAGEGEWPHSIVFSVWSILTLNIPILSVPSLSLRANSNPEFLTGGLYWKPCRWVLLNSTGYMNWTHVQMSSFIYPVFVPIHYKHLKQFLSPLVLSFSLLSPLALLHSNTKCWSTTGVDPQGNAGSGGERDVYDHSLSFETAFITAANKTLAWPKEEIKMLQTYKAHSLLGSTLLFSL